jgi:chromosome partitioning protein
VRSIGWLSEKGGVGKSTCAVNVAVGMAKAGRRVLAVDADPQANLSMVLLSGVPADAPTLYDVLVDSVEVAGAVRETTTPNLDVLPSSAQLADANVLLASELGRERRLRLAMQDLAGRYDVVVVDTGPARTLVNVNVLNAVGEVYAPCDPGIFGIAGLVALREAIAGVVKFLDNPGLRLAGLVVSRVQRDNLSRDTEAQLRTAFGPLVMTTTIPASVKIGEANARYLSVLDYAPGSPGARAFENLTREIMGNGQVERTGCGVDGTAEVDRADAGGTGRPARRRRAAG